MKRRLVTSALPYVNNVPHLGNLIQVLSADAFARFCRLRGYETLYICGTDEYGTATETRAAEEGISPRELCDRYHDVHAGIYRWFDIAFDKFGRTSTPIQTEVTQDIFRKLDAAGFITGREAEQLYCDSCGRFLADRYIRGTCPACGCTDARGDQCEQCGKLLEPAELGEPRCSVCGQKPRPRATKHLYIDLPKIKDRLEGWIKTASKEGFWANNAVRMTEAWIRDGLRERAITRDLQWGIPVPKPGYENKVFYVWFDAPIGYISITGCLGQERETGGWKAFADYWWRSPGETELFQFIGKDNIPFHTVIFPSSLLGSGGGWTMLHHMSSTEYLNYESGKFSKSKGIGVFGTDVMETGIPADVWRFYIFYNRPEKADALFTWKDFQEKVNGELIGNLGNLVNRTLSFVSRYYGGKIPGAGSGGEEGGGDSSFMDEVRKYEEGIARKLERAELRDAFRMVFELSSLANKRFQDTEPWRLRKEDPPRAAEVIRELSLVVRDMAVLTRPYMPGAAAKIASFFGLLPEKDLSWEDLGRAGKMDGTITSEVLFAKLEDEKIGELKERYSGSQKEREAVDPLANQKGGKGGAEGPPDSPPRSFTGTLDLRVAEIVKIERHPKADRLYVETLDIAGEERVIVSGLVPFYREDELLGKRIIVAYNLAVAKLRGIESRGMLLAASDHGGEGGAERVEVLDASGVPTGTRVLPEGAGAGDPPAEIDAGSFFAVPITVKNYVVFADGKPLTIAGKPLATGIISGGEVH
ncbi:MAG: methionine--tRNA ligase [Treponema sp.]|jgi:methionyl-tRNA synthetase|nr:methionine--tRNA ligase [Treponema sp.]